MCDPAVQDLDGAGFPVLCPRCRAELTAEPVARLPVRPRLGFIR